MARFNFFTLVKTLLLLLPPTAPKDTEISITLCPRDYVDPRLAEDFVCGVDKLVDPEHLIAENNANFILGYLDQTEDPSPVYKTKVFDVALLTKSGSLENMIDHLECPFTTKVGLYSLFIAPHASQCNSQTFKDAQEKGKDYYPVYINTNANFENALKKFESQSENLKENYGDRYPKLCGTMTEMDNSTAQSRVDILSSIFNFPYSPDQTRDIKINEEKNCRLKKDTENALIKSEMFENAENVGFQNSSATVFEFEGTFETEVVRTASPKPAIVFIKTKLGSADTDDLVPYDSILVFPKHQTNTKLLITIKIDNVYEENETFSIELVDSKAKNTRLKRGATQANQRKMTVTLLEKDFFNSLKDEKFLDIFLINNARLSLQESNSIQEFYLKSERNHGMGTSTTFLDIYEPEQTPVIDEKYRMRAYYFPYIKVIQNTNNIGWVDIPYKPKDNQPHMAFTGGMNGCAIIAVEKHDDDEMFRVYHLQSPGDRGGDNWNKYVNIIIEDVGGGNEIGSFAWEDYGVDSDDFFSYQGLNFLYYDSSEPQWYYVSQFNVITFQDYVNLDQTVQALTGLSMDQKDNYKKQSLQYIFSVKKVTKLPVFPGRTPCKNTK